MVNNIRDLETDRRAGKKTLAVRLGRPGARRLRAAGLPRVRHRAAGVGVRRRAPDAVAAAAVAGAADRGADRADRAQPRRRAVAQRRARPHRAAAARVLRPAVGRPAAVAVIGLSVRTERFTLRIKASWGELSEREVLVVRLDLPDGTWGEGEAAPLEPYDGVSMAEVRAALDAYAAVLGDDRADRRRARGLRRRARPPAGAGGDRPRAVGSRVAPDGDAARAADRSARGRLGAVNATIGAEDRAGAAARGLCGGETGFRCVKVKVGIGDDAGRLAAVRAAVGPEVGIRIDANGAWETPEYALANLRALEPVGLELCEEPVHGVEALREVRAGTRCRSPWTRPTRPAPAPPTPSA